MSYNEFVCAKLGEVALVVMGQSPKGEDCNENGIGIPLLNGPTEFGTSYPTPVQYTTDPKKKAKKGDLLFCVRGSTVGRMNWADREYAIGRGLASISPKYIGEEHYIKALIDYNLPYILNIATGSTFPNVSKDTLSQLDVWIAPREERINISRLFKSIDNKIELNNAINKNLEEMAQALFKQWFVDFEFPNENDEPYKSSGGEFEESELGLIPKGWKVSSLKNISTIMMGQSPKSEHYNTTGEGLPFHQGVSDYGYRFPKHNTFCTSLLKVAKKDSILISVRAPVGRLNIADRDIVIGRGLGAINSIVNCNSYLFYLLKRVFVVEDRHGSGTIFNSITKKELEEIKVINPPSIIIYRFEDIVKKIDQQISALCSECDYLSQIRDTLLPKLMSGEIRVPVEWDHSATELPKVAESNAIYQP